MKDKLLGPYNSYYGSVNIDVENNILFGKIEFIRALITYEAKDAESLYKAFQEAVDAYIEFCDSKGIEPEQPFKGSFNVRIGEERHRKVFLAAKLKGKTINDYIIKALDEVLDKNKETGRKTKISSHFPVLNKTSMASKRTSKGTTVHKK